MSDVIVIDNEGSRLYGRPANLLGLCLSVVDRPIFASGHGPAGHIISQKVSARKEGDAGVP